VAQGSGGQGRPAFIPWIAVFDPDETTSAQRGMYVVYLFAVELGTVTLSLNKGVTELVQRYRVTEGRRRLAQQAAAIRQALPPESIEGLTPTIEILRRTQPDVIFTTTETPPPRTKHSTFAPEFKPKNDAEYHQQVAARLLVNSRNCSRIATYTIVGSTCACWRYSARASATTPSACSKRTTWWPSGETDRLGAVRQEHRLTSLEASLSPLRKHDATSPTTAVRKMGSGHVFIGHRVGRRRDDRETGHGVAAGVRLAGVVGRRACLHASRRNRQTVAAYLAESLIQLPGERLTDPRPSTPAGRARPVAPDYIDPSSLAGIVVGEPWTEPEMDSTRID
jgi:hypothetical protein